MYVLVVVVVEDDKVIDQRTEDVHDLFLTEGDAIRLALVVHIFEGVFNVFKVKYYFIILAAYLAAFLGLDLSYLDEILAYLPLAGHLPQPHILQDPQILHLARQTHLLHHQPFSGVSVFDYNQVGEQFILLYAYLGVSALCLGTQI